MGGGVLMSEVPMYNPLDKGQAPFESSSSSVLLSSLEFSDTQVYGP